MHTVSAQCVHESANQEVGDGNTHSRWAQKVGSLSRTSHFQLFRHCQAQPVPEHWTQRSILDGPARKERPHPAPLGCKTAAFSPSAGSSFLPSSPECEEDLRPKWLSAMPKVHTIRCCLFITTNSPRIKQDKEKWTLYIAFDFCFK